MNWRWDKGTVLGKGISFPRPTPTPVEISLLIRIKSFATWVVFHSQFGISTRNWKKSPLSDIGLKPEH
jgi:hypothetical protein